MESNECATETALPYRLRYSLHLLILHSQRVRNVKRHTLHDERNNFTSKLCASLFVVKPILFLNTTPRKNDYLRVLWIVDDKINKSK